MTISSSVAKQLCTKTEQTLFTESLARNVKRFDENALRSRIARSRKLRDKYRQLADRQDREARGKQTPQRSRPAQGSAATRKKQQLFAESLERFEKRLTMLSSESKKTVKKSVKKGATSRTSKKRVAKKAPKKTAKGKAKKSVSRKTATKPAETPAKRPAKRPAKKRVTAADHGKEATSAAKEARFKKSSRKRIQTHISAQNRRNQARRDTR